MEFQLSRITGKQGMVKAHVMVWVVREWLTEWLILERSSSRFHGSFLLGLKSEHCRLKNVKFKFTSSEICQGREE